MFSGTLLEGEFCPFSEIPSPHSPLVGKLCVYIYIYLIAYICCAKYVMLAEHTERNVFFYDAHCLSCTQFECIVHGNCIFIFMLILYVGESES